jgi:hypothetical protein
MCWCTPAIRTPWCGKDLCQPPPQRPETTHAALDAQLRPCPGCGSPARLRAYRSIACTNDACWWEVEGPGTNEQLIARWNRRVENPHG